MFPEDSRINVKPSNVQFIEAPFSTVGVHVPFCGPRVGALASECQSPTAVVLPSAKL